MDLTQLEEFEPTELELLVAGNPSFQRLRKLWPIDWGELITGFRTKYQAPYAYSEARITFELIDKAKLSPHAAGKHLDQIAPDLRSILILVAKVAREAKPENEIDTALLYDFCNWLDKPEHFKGFRWERHMKTLEGQKKLQVKEKKTAELMQGDANVVVILTSRLSESEKDCLRALLTEGCIDRGVFSKDSLFERSLHLPRIECIQCENHRQRKKDHYDLIVMVDCGDVPTILKDVPRKMQKLVKPVRFNVPKNTFRECMSNTPAIKPSFLLYTFEQEDAGIDVPCPAKQAIALMEAWLKDGQKGQAEYYSGSQIIRPAGRQRLHAVIWADTLGNSEGILPENLGCSVSLVGERF